MFELIVFLFSIVGFMALGILNPDKKTGSEDDFLSDMRALGKVTLTTMFKGEFTADVTGQKGTRGFIVKGKSRPVWTIGADTLNKPLVEGIPIEGDKGKVIYQDRIKKRPDVSLSEAQVESHPLWAAVVAANVRQKSRHSKPEDTESD